MHAVPCIQHRFYLIENETGTETVYQTSKCFHGSFLPRSVIISGSRKPRVEEATSSIEFLPTKVT